MIKLTREFNTATAKKGETFQIDLIGGGFVGEVWDALVVSGKATLLSTDYESDKYIGCGPVVEKRVFKAEEVGEIEILAKSRFSACTFKVQVN